MAGIAIAGTLIAGTGLAMSLTQASRQKQLIAEAEGEANAAMERARKIVNTNYLEGLSIPKEAYELEREQLAVAGAQALQAGVEGEGRGAAATAGRVQMAQQAGQRQIAASQEQAMFDLQKQAAAEDARLQSVAANIELGGVQGAQQAVADATAARQAAIGQAASSAGQLGMSIIGNENINPLYKKQKTQPYEEFTKLSSGVQVNNKVLDGIIDYNQSNPMFGLESIQNPLNTGNMNSFITPIPPIETGLS
tara:strand:+ start:4848 stop:5600 length:753 start_codon:yes stop_codon:yes gene_type:complete